MSARGRSGGARPERGRVTTKLEVWERPFWHLGHRAGPTYTGLLALLLVNLAIQSATSDDVVARATSIVVSAAALLVVLNVVRNAPRARESRLISLAATGLALVCALAALADETASLGGWSRAIAAGLYLAAGLVALVDVLRHPSVTGQTIAGVLCVYLIIAYMFASVYATLNHLESPFFGQEDPGTGAFVYYSVITLTTVGYGDLSAATPLGRSISGIEALVGQLFLVTFVAGFVGTFRQGARPRSREDREVSPEEPS